MVMRLGQGVGFVCLCVYVCWAGGGGGGGALYTFVVGPNTENLENTQISAQTPHSQVGMGMHANTGMYINAQMPTLNTKIAKLQPVSS